VHDIKSLHISHCVPTCVDQCLDTVSNDIVLCTPPATEESNFHVDEVSALILVQLLKDVIEDVLHASLLNVIPSWHRKNTKTTTTYSTFACLLTNVTLFNKCQMLEDAVFTLMPSQSVFYIPGPQSLATNVVLVPLGVVVIRFSKY